MEIVWVPHAVIITYMYTEWHWIDNCWKKNTTTNDLVKTSRITLVYANLYWSRSMWLCTKYYQMQQYLWSYNNFKAVWRSFLAITHVLKCLLVRSTKTWTLSWRGHLTMTKEILLMTKLDLYDKNKKAQDKNLAWNQYTPFDSSRFVILIVGLHL